MSSDNTESDKKLPLVLNKKELPHSKTSLNQSAVPGYGLPKGEYYPNIKNVVAQENDKNARYSREDLKTCESCVNGYLFYVLGNAVFARDISGYFYKLNNETKQFEWFADGWLEDNEFTTGHTIPCPPTYISYSKTGLPIYPTNDETPPKPMLPKNEKGEQIFPTDPETRLPLFPIDFNGQPCLPVGDDGKPSFPMDHEGRPMVPINSEGIAVFPKDGNGNALYPQRLDGKAVPPVTIYGNPVAAINSKGEVEIPYDSNGNPMIYMGGPDKMTPMTEEEYQQWQYTTAVYNQTYPEDSYFDVSMYEMSQNEEKLYNYRNSYYEEQQVGEHVPLASQVLIEEKKTSEEIEAEKRKKKLELKLKSIRKTIKMNKVGAAPESSNQVNSEPFQKSIEKTVKSAIIPANRPPLPNKEKERKERYIPEKVRSNNFEWNNKNRHDRTTIGYQSSTHRNRSDRKNYEKEYNKYSKSERRSRERRSARKPIERSRSRSRSLTYSPDVRRKIQKRSRSHSASSSSSAEKNKRYQKKSGKF